MPVEILANTFASAAGSLAFLLNPAPTYQPARVAPAEAPAAAAPAEHLLGDWGGLRHRLSDHGCNFTVQYIGEVAGNVAGGVRRGAVYNGLLIVAGDADLEKAAGWQGAAFHVGALLPHGRSLTDDYVHDLARLSNLDASDHVHLFELWLEQTFAAGKFSVRLGQLAVDQEFAFTTEGALFNNSTFGWHPTVGSPAPVYPQGAPGVRLKWKPSEKTFLQSVVVDGDVNPLDTASRETNPHGVKFRFDEGALAIAEAGCNWELHTKPGTFKVGGWYHTARQEDVRFDNSGRSLADPASSGIAQTHNGNWGFYAAGEQIVWREKPGEKDSAEGLGVFGRLGYAVPDRNTLDFYAEGGVTSVGLIPGRDEDVCGLGVAYGKLSGDQRALGRDQNFFNHTSAPLPDHELVIELEYQCKLFKGFAVQPGLQYIVHPGGSGAIADALVVGLRTVFDF